MSYIQRENKFRHKMKVRVWALFLCLCMFTVFCPIPAEATYTEPKLFQSIAEFESITLHENADGKPGVQISENTLLSRDKQVVLNYTYKIMPEKIQDIEADAEYYLDISPHLVLPDLKNGSALTIETEESHEQVEFARLYADGTRAWITFQMNAEGSGTVLSEYDELNGAYFYLHCGRAPAPPESEPPMEEAANRYIMRFENGEHLVFGYEENEPVQAKARIQKHGNTAGKTIIWEIAYTPWQNPAAEDGVTPDTLFELRDTIVSARHSYVEGSAEINGQQLAACTRREDIPMQAEAYVLVETGEDGNQVLSFGGTKFSPGRATNGNPAESFKITYKTQINEELLLPGEGSSQEIRNEAGVFAEKDGGFEDLGIQAAKTVKIARPAWLEKSGTTTRHQDGTGAETDWTVKFYPNEFTFDGENALTLCDRLPEGSTLAEQSVKVNQAEVSVHVDEQTNEFKIAGLSASGSQPVVITYKTTVPEEMYDSGTGLGDNTAWFTFLYNGRDYKTPQVKVPVNSGNGSGSSGTATLEKSNTGYSQSDRSISWQVVINPHRADLKSAVFTDDLRAGSRSCGIDGHKGGMELPAGVGDVSVLIEGQKPQNAELVKLEYENDRLIIAVKDIGRKIVTLSYTAKVCDPCIFAANTSKEMFKNTISTENMIIGNTGSERRAEAVSQADVSAAVLKKKEPVYDYAQRTMHWTVDVNESGLAMTDINLTDALPDGLSYKPGSLTTVPDLAGAEARVLPDGGLAVNLGEVNGKTTVAFDTEVDPEIFNNDSGSVTVSNTISMTGRADGIEFEEVSHTVAKSFTNHGLVKSSMPQPDKELISYEVLVNPFGLRLPKDSALVDTLDKRLQIDLDTLRFYKAEVSGTSDRAMQKPDYKKIGEGLPLEAESFDPEENSIRVKLPVAENDTGAYVLAYTADMIEVEKGSYGNSVRFDSSTVFLGGGRNNSASIGGGGGGGGGVAARKASITVVKSDHETGDPLEGVTFTLFQWKSDVQQRGLPLAQAVTDSSGRITFRVKPDSVYELEETKGISGYDHTPGWLSLPAEAEDVGDGVLRITAGAAKSQVQLELTNQPDPKEGTDGGGDTDEGGDHGDTGGSGNADGTDGNDSGTGGNGSDTGGSNGSTGGSGAGDSSGADGTGGSLGGGNGGTDGSGAGSSGSNSGGAGENGGAGGSLGGENGSGSGDSADGNGTGGSTNSSAADESNGSAGSSTDSIDGSAGGGNDGSGDDSTGSGSGTGGNGSTDNGGADETDGSGADGSTGGANGSGADESNGSADNDSSADEAGGSAADGVDGSSADGNGDGSAGSSTDGSDSSADSSDLGSMENNSKGNKDSNHNGTKNDSSIGRGTKNNGADAGSLHDAGAGASGHSAGRKESSDYPADAAQNLHIPNTRDLVPWLAGILILLGAVLAVMTIYHFLYDSKKKESNKE